MTASRLRLENISIFNYIQCEVITPNFSELAQSIPLVYNPSTSVFDTVYTREPSPTSVGRGWVYFDDYAVGSRMIPDTSTEQTSKVTVVGASSYTINYLNGTISNPDTTPTSVSFYWNYVSVIPSWPGVTPPPLPFVSMGIDGREKSGFQLGGGTRNLSTVYFYVFATSDSERDDISETIHDSLFNHTITIKDFSGGGYLNYDGTYNSTLVKPLSNFGTLRFIKNSNRNINSQDDIIELNSHRSIVSGTYESFRDTY